MFRNIKHERIKLLTFVVIVFVFILILFGVINIYKSSKIINNQANANFKHIAEDIRESEDKYLADAEEEVQRCKNLIELTIDEQKLNAVAPAVYKYNKYKIPYVSQYLNSIVAPLLLRTAKNTSGVMSIFFDFDHEFFTGENLIGIWYTDKHSKEDFKLTDNGLRKTMYPVNREDLEWFYLPKKLKKGVWSKLYVDDDLKVDMVTYSAPVYSGKKFIGVVGTDISMEKIKSFICQTKLYDSGKIYLLDMQNRIIFSKDYAPLTDAKIIDKNLFSILDNISKNKVDQLQYEEVRLVKSSTQRKLFAITKLYNGFILVLEVPVKELYAENNKLIAFTSYSLILAILVALLMAIEAYGKIKQINNELLHKEKLISIGKMSAEIAHEINSPLGYVNCNIDTLKKFVSKIKAFMLSCENQFNKVVDKEITFEEQIECIHGLREEFKIDYVLNSVDELIDESKEGIKKVSEIVVNLKNFAKDDSQDAKSNENIEKIIDDALIILGNKIENNIEIVRTFGSISPLLCNKNQLKQVFINLLDNACYSFEKKEIKDKKITISTYEKLGSAFIEIEDNGIGIDKNKLNKIFDSFFTTKALGDGTGLGLSISRDIITKKHKGEIFVESKKGKGTKFTIRIPYQ